MITSSHDITFDMTNISEAPMILVVLGACYLLALTVILGLLPAAKRG